MRYTSLIKRLFVICLLTLATTAHSGTPYTYPNFKWQVQTNGNYNQYTALRLDLTGDLQSSTMFSVAGTLGKPGSNPFGIGGNGYFLGSGLVFTFQNMHVSVWVCTLTSPAFNGTCTINYFSGIPAESATLTFIGVGA